MTEVRAETVQARTDAAAEPTTGGGCGCGGCGCGGGGGEASGGLQIVPGGSSVEPGDLDLRGLPPQERHARVFAAVSDLLPGEAFVLANDHDPVRLREQLQDDELGRVAWQYLAEGPAVWRVLVSRDTCC
ncbi:DUF2249 domain-containing protein [Actinotalea sp. AC32]|nr:DUF2249 domain-containing protein [Actinotalea sp. AC32]